MNVFACVRYGRGPKPAGVSMSEISSPNPLRTRSRRGQEDVLRFDEPIWRRGRRACFEQSTQAERSAA